MFTSYEKDYLHELPEKIIQNVFVSLNEKERLLYELIRNEALDKLAKAPEEQEESKKKIQILAALMKLRLASCHPSLVSEESFESSSKLELLNELLDPLRVGDSQALIFSQFTSF